MHGNTVVYLGTRWVSPKMVMRMTMFGNDSIECWMDEIQQDREGFIGRCADDLVEASMFEEYDGGWATRYTVSEIRKAMNHIIDEELLEHNRDRRSS